MILRRLGNKSKIAKEIQAYFPPHKIYVEPFFGAGGMFFNKPKVKHNIVNDIDSDVFNLFQVVSNQKEKIRKEYYKMPIHLDLLNYWKENKETEPIKKALRFLFLSNLTLMGLGGNIRLNRRTPKQTFYDKLDKTFDLIHDVQFFNASFDKFLNSISIDREEENIFIYSDPPYLSTSNNYSNSFKENDLKELIKVLIETGCKFAISEFNNPVVLALAKDYELEVITIGERRNLRNKRTEILIINYDSPQLTLF